MRASYASPLNRYKAYLQEKSMLLVQNRVVVVGSIAGGGRGTRILEPIEPEDPIYSLLFVRRHHSCRKTFRVCAHPPSGYPRLNIELQLAKRLHPFDQHFLPVSRSPIDLRLPSCICRGYRSLLNSFLHPLFLLGFLYYSNPDGHF